MARHTQGYLNTVNDSLRFVYPVKSIMNKTDELPKVPELITFQPIFMYKHVTYHGCSFLCFGSNVTD